MIDAVTVLRRLPAGLPDAHGVLAGVLVVGR
jgi:hypothetical protein